MHDLTKYLADKARLVELEALVVKHAKELAAVKRAHAKELAAADKSLKRAAKQRGYYKAQWRAATAQHETPTDKARKLIKQAKSSEYRYVASECRRIAAEVGMGARSVHALWYLEK